MLARSLVKKKTRFGCSLRKLWKNQSEATKCVSTQKTPSDIKFFCDEHFYITETDIVRNLIQPVIGSSARITNMAGFADDQSDLRNLH